MKLNISKISAPLILSLLALIAVLDVVFPEDHPNRFIAVYVQALVLGISMFYLIKTYTTRIKRTALHTSLLVFIAMLVVYGIFTPNLSILPILLYALVFFYLAYYLTYKGFLQLKHIQILAVFLLVVYSYETYLGIFERAERLGDFFRKADNTGYKSLFLMLLFTFDLKKPRNIIFISITYVLVLFSFKRGAMLSGTLAYALAMWPVITGKFHLKKKIRQYLILIGFLVAGLIVYFAIQYWDVLVYRFVTDETGGSGRDLFWSEIVRGWREGDIINQVFGFGLYTVPEFLRTSMYGGAIYAHSDWYELLYDHGILGIIIYSTVLISALSQRKIVYRYANELYYVYLMSFAIWLPKSYFSGVYINKGTIILTLVLGIILAISYRNKAHETNTNKHY